MDSFVSDRPQRVLEVSDLTKTDIENILNLSLLKQPSQVFAGKGAALIFEHPSARTRNAAEMAVFQLGGHPVSIAGAEIGIDKRETAEDVARVLARYHSLIGARVARHDTLVRMADALSSAGSNVPVVNLLSDKDHVTQALADAITIKQNFGDLSAVEVAYIGDPNNVCHSLCQMAKKLGFSLRVAAPEKYLEKAHFLDAFLREDTLERVPASLGTEEHVAESAAGGTVSLFTDPAEAAENADVLYTDVFVSMGEENSAEKKSDYSGYGISRNLLSHAAEHALVMHCLPAHRGEEIEAEVLEGPRSVVFDQAENRMHAMRGLFAYLLGAPVAEIGESQR